METTSKEYRILFNAISSIVKIAMDAQISAEDLVIKKADMNECDEIRN